MNEVMKELNISMQIMDTDAFIGLPDYYANRNVNRRMGKAHMKGVLTSNAQRQVAACELDGNLFKIDGHSRSEAWTRGQLQKPATVACVIYHCETIADVHQLYKAMVSKLTAETKAESGYSARKRIGYEPTSPFCQGSWGSALNILGYKDDESGMMKYLEQFKVIDSWAIPYTRTRQLGGGIKAAMLKTLSMDEAKARKFWIKYMQDGIDNPSVRLLLTHMMQEGAGGAWDNSVYQTAIDCFTTFNPTQE